MVSSLNNNNIKSCLSVLIGSDGMGKTRLSHEIGYKIINNNIMNSVLYVPLYSLTLNEKLNNYISCLNHQIINSNFYSLLFNNNNITKDLHDKLLTNINKIDLFKLLCKSNKLGKILIILENMDKFIEHNNISQNGTLNFLNYIINTTINNDIKNLNNINILITSTKNLKIYNNFFIFKTQYYYLTSLDQQSIIKYFLHYTHYNRDEILLNIDNIKNTTGFKPYLLEKFHKIYSDTHGSLLGGLNELLFLTQQKYDFDFDKDEEIRLDNGYMESSQHNLSITVPNDDDSNDDSNNDDNDVEEVKNEYLNVTPYTNRSQSGSVTTSIHSSNSPYSHSVDVDDDRYITPLPKDIITPVPLGFSNFPSLSTTSNNYPGLSKNISITSYDSYNTRNGDTMILKNRGNITDDTEGNISSADESGKSPSLTSFHSPLSVGVNPNTYDIVGCIQNMNHGSILGKINKKSKNVNNNLITPPPNHSKNYALYHLGGSNNSLITKYVRNILIIY